MFCPFCGKKVEKKTENCPHCNNPLPESILAGLPEDEEKIQDETMPAEETVSTQIDEAQVTQLSMKAEPQEETAEITSAAVKAEFPEPEIQQIQEKYSIQPEKKKKGMNPVLRVLLILIPLGLVACVILAGVLIVLQPSWLPFDLPTISLFEKKAPSAFLAGFPGRDNEFDVELFSKDDPVEIYEEINYPNAVVANYVEDGEIITTLFGPAALIPNTDLSILKVFDEDSLFLYVVDSNKDEPYEIFESDNNFHNFLLEDQTIIVIETDMDNQIAYVSKNFEEAERVVKADYVRYIPGINQFLVMERDDEEQTWTIVNIDGEETGELLVTEESISPLLDIKLSPAGKLMTITVSTDEGDELRLYDLTTQLELSVVDNYTVIRRVDFSKGQECLYLIGEDEEGMLSLEAAHDGIWVKLFDGEEEISATIASDSNHMAVVTYNTEDEESTVYIVDLDTEEIKEVYKTGNELQLTRSVSPLPERFFVIEISEDMDFSLLSFDYAGNEPLVLFEESDYAMHYDRIIDGFIFLTFQNTEEEQYTWVTSPDKEDGFYLMEDWSSISILDLDKSKNQVLIDAVEDPGDEHELYIVQLEENADEILLDDGIGDIENAYFLPDENAVVYSVVTGSDYDEIEIRKVNRDGESDYEEVVEEAQIISTAWAWYDMRSRGALITIEPIVASGLDTVRIDEHHPMTLPADVSEAEYKINVNQDVIYYVSVKGDDEESFDPNLRVYNADGEVLNERNSVDSNILALFFTPQGTNYATVKVENNLDVGEEVGFDFFVQSIHPIDLTLNQTHSDFHTADEFIDTPTEGDWVLDVFRFELEEDSEITVLLEGSETVNRFLYVLDEAMTFIKGDVYNDEDEIALDDYLEAGVYHIFVSVTDFDESMDNEYEITVFSEAVAVVTEEVVVETEEVVVETATEEVAMDDELVIGYLIQEGDLEDEFNPDPKVIWDTLLGIENSLGYYVEYREIPYEGDKAAAIEGFIDDGFNTIFVGISDYEDLYPVLAAMYPEVRFIFLNQSVDADLLNVTWLTFDSWETGFLGGAFAAAVTQNGTISGVFGTSEWNYFQMLGEGFSDGSQFYSQVYNVEINSTVTNLEGEFSEVMYDAELGKETADQVVSFGTDVIFQVAMETGDYLCQQAATYSDVYCITIYWLEDTAIEGSMDSLIGTIINDYEWSIWDMVLYHTSGDLAPGEYRGKLTVELKEEFRDYLLDPDYTMEQLDILSLDLYDGQILYEDFH